MIPGIAKPQKSNDSDSDTSVLVLFFKIYA